MQAFYIEFILAGFAILLLLAEAFFIPKGMKSVLALGGIAALGIVLILMNTAVDTVDSLKDADAPNWMSRFYEHSSQALVFKNIALISTILVLLLSLDFRSVLKKFTCEEGSDAHTGEFYALPLFACAGMMWMASATDFVSIFVSLELVTICFYIMVAYMKRNVGSLEAGVKYLILGALSTGILVYGIAWIYGAFGTTHIPTLSHIISNTGELSTTALFGIALVIIALAFKVGAVPMQLWIPDVYQGAPTPVTAFLSVASKASGFAIAITILTPFLQFEQVHNVLLILAGATLLYGNFAAISQTNFKRLLAYSSIAHAGFILIALAYGKADVVIFYLVTYMLMTFGAFFALNNVRVNENSDEISALNGLSKRNPTFAVFLTVIMAAMAGLPLTVGFYGKFLVFETMFTSGSISIILALISFASVGAGFYYYFKVIKAMYWEKPVTETPIAVSIISSTAIFVISVLIVLFGFLPKALSGLFGIW